MTVHGIPYVIEGIINNFEKLIERPPDIFKSKYGIDIIVNTCAYKIDRFRKPVVEFFSFLSLVVNIADQCQLSVYLHVR